MVICARDPVSLLGGWELMTVIPAAMILVAHDREAKARRSVWVYLGVTHIGGAGTWIAILLMAHAGAIGGHVVMQSGSALQIAVALAALVGLGTKAGLMPFHIWLPRAHPIAPAPVSALMSGVMIKISIYLLIRILIDWIGPLPTWIGILVLALGALSSVAGVTYAIFEHELKRLLAMHSIENIGIITLGIGACLLLRSNSEMLWASFALGAALFHSMNHAIFKSLLFMGAGTFERYIGALNIDHLGGLLRRLPIAGGCFLVGSMAIAGLPPLNGFASEWLTIQSLVHLSRFGSFIDSISGAIALALLATTAALAVLCFVKVIGLVLLGAARTRENTASKLPSKSMDVSLGFLALCCIILGTIPGIVFTKMASLGPWNLEVRSSLGLHLPGTGSLPTLWIAGLLACITALLLLFRGRSSAQLAPTWICGQDQSPRLRWTSAGFSKPLKMTLETILRPTREIAFSERGSITQKVAYSGHLPHHFETHIYAPIHRLMLAVANTMRRMQSGSLSTYVFYLIGLVLAALLAVHVGLVR
jgi:hydrogenase-4 component B